MIATIIAKRNIKSALKKINNRDLDGFLKDWSDNAVFNFPGNLYVSGKFEGLVKVRAWFENFLDTYPTIEFRIENIYAKKVFDLFGFSNKLVAELSIKLENSNGEKLSNQLISVIQIKNRKVVSVQDYFFDWDKLAIGWGEGKI